MEEGTRKQIIVDHGHSLAKLIISAVVGYAASQLIGRGYDAALQSYRSKHTEE